MAMFGRVFSNARFVLATGALMGFLAAGAHAQEVQMEGDVRYVTGGVGMEEREQLETLARNERMNLKLVFSELGGPFVASVPVTLTDAGGDQVLQVTTDGPWLFARLPAGEYRYRAVLRGVVQEGTVTVPETGRVEQVIAFP